MKKVLLITYYWPPCGGVAVQRWLKMVKYISLKFDVTVYAPRSPEYPTLDYSLENEIPKNITILKENIFEPYELFRKLTFKKKSFIPQQEFVTKKKNWIDRLAVWVRGNFFIPDARKFWIKPSIRFLSNEFRSKPFDVVITNGTPHSVHLIGLGLKQKFDIKWIADFRDPWTQVDYFDNLMLTKWARKKHLKLEQAVLTNADLVTTVSPSWGQDFKNLGAQHVEILYNGYELDDFATQTDHLDSDAFVISHVGSLNEGRNKDSFWAAVAKSMDGNSTLKEKIRIDLIGSVSSAAMDSIKKYGLEAQVNYLGNLSHRDALNSMMRSNVLLLLLGDLTDMGRIPAKVFEYMAAQKPILAIASPESDVAKIINENNLGAVVSDNAEEIAEALSDIYLKKRIYDNAHLSTTYSRKSVSFNLISLINALWD